MEPFELSPLNLQRLVDGELSASERRAVLQRLDQAPEQWRAVGLALLEDQAFRRESKWFGSVGGESPTDIVDQPVEPVQINKPVAPNQSKFARYRLATAACLLIAVGFGTGYGLRRQSTFIAPDAATLAANANSPNRNDSNAASLVSDSIPRPVGELHFAGDEASNEAVASGVPVFEVRPDHVQRMMEQQLQQVNEWNRQLQRRGLQLDWQPEMLESRLPDGRAVVVPVNQWNVRPIGQ